MSKYQKALVINDLHIPFQDDAAVEIALRVGDAIDPDVIFLNGDIMDCWQISHYVKDPRLHSTANIKHEIAETRHFLKKLRKRFSKSRIIYTFGNHEYRWVSYLIGHAIDLVGLEGLSLEEQLKTEELKIEVVNNGTKENSYLWGKILIGHFDRVTKHSGATARALLEDKAISLMQAHTHRGGSSFRRLYDRDIVGYENFCLCSRDPGYCDRPNWQLGLSTIINDMERFHVTQHPIIVDADGWYRTWFDGKEFKAQAGN